MGQVSQDPKERFWAWFLRNEGVLYDPGKDEEKVFDELTLELEKVHPDLTFEFGPKTHGRRELVVSAGGVRVAFPAVEALVAAAPALVRWQFIAFRPRCVPLCDVEYNHETVRVDDVRFIAVPDGKKIGVTLLVPGFRRTDERTFEHIGYIFLDQALGERAVEAKIGFIEVTGRVEPEPPQARPLTDLALLVDNWDAT